MSTKLPTSLVSARRPRFFVQGAAFLAAIFATFTLPGCSSYDLSASQPTQVAVNVDNPTWDNGIGLLIATKCASCHNANRGNFVPGKIPTSMDQIGNSAFFDPASSIYSKGKIITAKNRAFPPAGFPGQQMPPNFATPLTTDEQTALLRFFTAAVR